MPLQGVEQSPEKLLITNCKFATSINIRNSRLHNTFMYSYRKNVATQRKGIQPPVCCSMQCTPCEESNNGIPFLPSCTSMCVLLNLQMTTMSTRTESFKFLEQTNSRSRVLNTTIYLYVSLKADQQYHRSFRSLKLC
jgi:hypothetical protein